MLTFWTSSIFITNMLAAFFQGQILYSFLFGGLTTTSFLFHYNKNNLFYFLDQFFVLSIVFYGFIVIFEKRHFINLYQLYIILLCFFLTIFLFYYGYLTGEYCYDPIQENGEYYHAFLHIISSLGHHIIIFL